MSQKAYEQALKEYEKQSKLEMTKQYAQLVKEGNRKAIEKAKEIRNIHKKNNKKSQYGIEKSKEHNKNRPETKQEYLKPKLSEN